jgi:hypothetical protein
MKTRPGRAKVARPNDAKTTISSTFLEFAVHLHDVLQLLYVLLLDDLSLAQS